MRAQFVLSEIRIGLRRNLTMTVAVVVTVAISLALLGSALMIREQVSTMKDFWYDKVEVSVFLCGTSSTAPGCGGGTPVTDDQRTALRDQLTAMPQVEEVFYESQDQAYAQFRTSFKDSPELVDNVTAEALPESLRVKLEDPTQFGAVAAALRGQPGVEQVQDQKALLKGFFDVLNKVQLIALVVAGVQIVAAVLLISNTIRVAAFSRRRETGIMRLVGASNLYIRMPFLLEGVFAGLVGAALACGGLAVVQSLVVDGQLRPVSPVALIGWGDVLHIAPVLLVSGAVVAGLSSFVTLRRHLKV